MTSKELYYEFHLLLNKNNENSDINVDPSNFVILFNRESKRWLSEKIDKYNHDKNIFDLQEFLKKDVKLFRNERKKEYVTYQLPEDYFHIIYGSSYSLVEKGECVKKIFNFFVKPNDINTTLNDTFRSPDFDWERGLVTLSENELVVYKQEEVKIEDTFISYYKIPKEIDIEGYVKIDGTQSVDVDPNISDLYLESILDRIVTEVTRQFSPQELQIALERQTH